MASQSVARSARYYAQRRAGMHNGTSHFVDSTVASDSHNNVHTVVFSLGCNLRGMPCILGYSNLVLELCLVEILVDKPWYGRLVRCAGYKVYNENGFFLHTCS